MLYNTQCRSWSHVIKKHSSGAGHFYKSSAALVRDDHGDFYIETVLNVSLRRLIIKNIAVYLRMASTFEAKKHCATPFCLVTENFIATCTITIKPKFPSGCPLNATKEGESRGCNSSFKRKCLSSTTYI